MNTCHLGRVAVRIILCFALAFAIVAPARAQGDSVKATGRAVLGKYQDALVSVKLALKSGNIESQAEIAGTVISPSGLTVVSDFSSNPGGLLGDDGGRNETTDVKLILKDGKEIPAKFVVRDRDLDLAFVIPKDTQGLKLTFVPIPEKGIVPEPLDEVIYLHRLGRSLNRQASLAVGRVEAVATKPRLFIVPDILNGLQCLGCPAFDGQGRPMGIVVVRRSARALKIPSGIQDLLDLIQPVILGSDDVHQAAKQADKPAE